MPDPNKTDVAEMKSKLLEVTTMVGQMKALSNMFGDIDVSGITEQLKKDHPPERLSLEDAFEQNNYTSAEIAWFLHNLPSKLKSSILNQLESREATSPN